MGSGPELVELDRDVKSKKALERVVLEQRAQELRGEARKQARQRAFLREERKQARDEKEAIAKDKEMLTHHKKHDWFPEAYLPGPKEKRLRVNVGGQIFEISKKFLDQDQSSLLYALSSDDCPLYNDNAKMAYVDRDWWTFRYVLTFLRDGVLPASRSAVLQLYQEATFWRLETLQRAIEETHLNLTRTTILIDDDPKSDTFGLLKEETMAKKSKFWLNKPNWWERTEKEVKKEKPKPDWWLDKDEYNKTRYLPLSADPEKVVATKDDMKAKKDLIPAFASTWGYYS